MKQYIFALALGICCITQTSNAAARKRSAREVTQQQQIIADLKSSKAHVFLAAFAQLAGVTFSAAEQRDIQSILVKTAQNSRNPIVQKTAASGVISQA